MLPSEADFIVYFKDKLLPSLEQWEAERLKLLEAQKKESDKNNQEILVGILAVIGVLFLAYFVLVGLWIIGAILHLTVLSLLQSSASVFKLSEGDVHSWAGWITFAVCTLIVVLGISLCVVLVLHFSKKKKTKPSIPISTTEESKFKDMQAFTSAFKSDVIPRVAAFFLTHASYSAKSGFSINDIAESGLTTHPIHYLMSEDLFQGQFNGINVSFGDLYVETEMIIRRRIGTGEYQNITLVDLLSEPKYEEERKRVPLLKGIFVKASFNKTVKGRVIVVSEMKNYDTKHYQLQSVKLDHPEFEKRFKVFANDAQLSYYTLSLSFMERLLEFASHFQNSTPSFALHQENLYIELRGKSFLFEKKIDEPVNRYTFIKRTVFDELHRVLSLIEILDLDTTIWAKD
jgi:hypothetical protein